MNPWLLAESAKLPSINHFLSPDEVREAVMRIRNALDDGAGGVIGQCEWGKDNPRENVEAVFDARLEPRD